ncbi:MAG: histidinol dehydrogenase [Actinobacteria bacterium]|nr:histidinol dehydrogenase [Actinomycetota bacterium]MSZ02123.1 histidinol dehydrogenase [Actinomycetota bacterium]
MRTVDFRGRSLSKIGYRNELPRAELDIDTALLAIAPILDQVKNGNESALLDLCEKFDGVRPKSIRVPISEMQSALDSLDLGIREALEEAIRRVSKAHTDQLRNEIFTQVVRGGEVTHKQIPVDRVGLYVPGGRAVYPSSVIMNVVPAQIANVASIAVASPPQIENGGLPNKTILATCALLGITEVYAIGGAQAIAMFAYGVEGICEGVDVITGPGNIYVAAAKRALRGLVGIDSEAGPTEVAILADQSAKPNEVAADLISQAEHDVIAAAILITDSLELADAVKSELGIKVAKTKHQDRIRIALSGKQSAIVLVDSISQGVDVANAYAAEHLEIQTVNSKEVSKQIRNAGAVFIGRFTPVSLGDYSAGSNHVLPTGGCACHSSGLSVQTFLKGVSFIEYDKSAFTEIAANVITLANSEDLPAHGEAMSARFEGNE